jgi:hypothetical protein
MKIAFVSGYYFLNNKEKINDELRTIFNALYKSAKNHFLKNHDVDFIFLTNGQDEIENVKNIHFDYEIKQGGTNHAIVLQILSLKYIKDNYDYIFIHDHDQIYVNDVDENLLLNSDFVLLDHFWKPARIDELLPHITTLVDMNFDTSKEFWTMGSFYGGKGQVVKELVEKSWIWHDHYLALSNGGFYANYPAEVFVIKFVFENNINNKRLSSHMNPTELSTGVFFSNIEMLGINNIDEYESKIKNVTLLHNTKSSFSVLENILQGGKL